MSVQCQLDIYVVLSNSTNRADIAHWLKARQSPKNLAKPIASKGVTELAHQCEVDCFNEKVNTFLNEN